MRQGVLEILLLDENNKALKELTIEDDDKGTKTYAVGKSRQEYIIQVRIYRNNIGEFPSKRFRIGICIDGTVLPYWKRIDLTNTNTCNQANSDEEYITATFLGFKKNASDLRALEFTKPSIIYTDTDTHTDADIGLSSSSGNSIDNDGGVVYNDNRNSSSRRGLGSGLELGLGCIRATLHVCDTCTTGSDNGAGKDKDKDKGKDISSSSEESSLLYRFHEVPTGHITGHLTASSSSSNGSGSGCNSGGSIGSEVTIDADHPSLITRAGRPYAQTHIHTQGTSSGSCLLDPFTSLTKWVNRSSRTSNDGPLEVSLYYHSSPVMVALMCQKNAQSVATAGRGRSGRSGSSSSCASASSATSSSSTKRKRPRK